MNPKSLILSSIFYFKLTGFLSFTLKMSRPNAEDLTCIFQDLVKDHKNIGLSACGTKTKQTWRHADSPAAKKRLPLYHPYIPELVDLHSSLSSYSICETHYNQLISKDNFYQQLLNNSLFPPSSSSSSSVHQFQTDTNSDNNSTSISRTHEEVTDFIGSHLSIERAKNLFDKSQDNSDVTYAITELLFQLEIQKGEIIELRKNISEYCEEIVHLEDRRLSVLK